MIAADAALIERLIPAVAAGIHAADPATLQHEAERYEAQQPSPLVLRMRQIVADEQALRAATGSDAWLVWHGAEVAS